MHCPSCGTENVPDSRFCGTCGAKLAPAVVSRVAPTAKIPDDATFPAPLSTYNAAPGGPPSIPPNYYPQPASIPPNSYIAPHYGTGPASIAPQNSGPSPVPHRPASVPPRPASLPPLNHGPASLPPGAYQAPGYAREPSMSMPVAASPRWGLIVFLLVLDLGLAGAGAFLLEKGLAKPDVPAEKVEPKAAATGSIAPAPSPSGAPSATPVTAAAPPPGLAASVSAIAQTAQTAPPAPVAPAPKKPVAVAKVRGALPEDPYDAKASLPGEIELAAARSKDDLARCQAQESGEIVGRIDISFTVERNGSVTRVTTTKDSTGSRTLAPCLGSVISRWLFASHPANATDFVRPFIYN
ncbi:hypothetical protein BH11MYX1_BH11MYX1_35060 [soil metagenome]